MGDQVLVLRPASFAVRLVSAGVSTQLPEGSFLSVSVFVLAVARTVVVCLIWMTIWPVRVCVVAFFFGVNLILLLKGSSGSCCQTVCVGVEPFAVMSEREISLPSSVICALMSLAAFAWVEMVVMSARMSKVVSFSFIIGVLLLV